MHAIVLDRVKGLCCRESIWRSGRPLPPVVKDAHLSFILRPVDGGGIVFPMTDSTLHYTRVPIANEQNTMMGLMHRGGDNASICLCCVHWSLDWHAIRAQREEEDNHGELQLGLCLGRSCLTPDSGNLVVHKQGSGGDVLWQSFEHLARRNETRQRPTDWRGVVPGTWYLTALGSPLPCELVPRVTLIWN
jgi:hypothetical protein